MKNYKIILQYDGTRYKGWQIQKNTDMTIQGKLTAVLERLAGHSVEVHGSGRTDAGVHALAQVANFKMEEHFSKEKIFSYLNEYLPEDIAVLSIEEAPLRFHSRLNAVSKTYRYRIWNDRKADVFLRKQVEEIPQELDLGKMKQAAQYVLGTHDFAAFCGNRKMKKSTVRTIMDISIERVGKEVRLTFTGNGFLQNMVRILTGTLVEVGLGEREPASMKEILESRDREKAGYTISPKGLTLMSVEYDEKEAGAD